ncbi:hypothetical protein EMA8858_01648 [Emticicia aquatica]|uniref:Uncharacterized protein n=1 Tax=Emticicia aquatica TaxID=1681835 RepID=A0ABM9APU4_9BACT|nr:hypothetical protein EMA8858_01648 [Emticicia aquatica]
MYANGFYPQLAYIALLNPKPYLNSITYYLFDS